MIFVVQDWQQMGMLHQVIAGITFTYKLMLKFICYVAVSNITMYRSKFYFYLVKNINA